LAPHPVVVERDDVDEPERVLTDQHPGEHDPLRRLKPGRDG
jgi:hypothetical protein